jgi:hypothetical protein
VNRLLKESTMQIRSVVVVAALGFASFAHGQSPAVQWRIEDGGNGHWYEVIVHEQGRTWYAAAAHSAERGGHLATITSQAEHEFALSLVGMSGPWFAPSLYPDVLQGPWLGAFRHSLDSPWTWVTGEAWDFTAFCSNQPSNQASACLQPELYLHVKLGSLCFGSQGWGDITPDGVCDPEVHGLSASLVEWSADCNGDGIVDYGQILDGTFDDVNGTGVPDICELPVQWRIEDGGNGHWYLLTAEARYWEVHRQAAISLGGHLVAITSAAENAFVYALLPAVNPSAFFIGGIKQSGTWAWDSGEAWGYTNWDVGEPNGVGDQITWIHGSLAPRPATWNDHPAYDYMFRAVIEFDADCNGDGIVDYGQILNGTFADVNSNGVPDCCDAGESCDPCPGDITGGGQVNGVDLAAILGAWGTDGQGKLDCDINDDGTVDAQDLAIVLGGWGNCP